MSEEQGFLARWSRRKVQARQGELPPEPVAQALSPTPLPQGARGSVPPAALPPSPRRGEGPGERVGVPPPAPTLAEVEQLTPASDFSRFVAPGVDGGVKNAALKKLFTDPHFNVMDGLDTYIDDYSQPDPLPASMLRQMAQSKFLGLFSDEDEAEAAVPPGPATPEAVACDNNAAPDEIRTDEDPDLRLQPHDAARRASPEPGAGADAGRKC